MLVYPTYNGSASAWTPIVLGTIPSNIKVLNAISIHGGSTGENHTIARCAFGVNTNGNVQFGTWEDSVSSTTLPLSPIIVPIKVIE